MNCDNCGTSENVKYQYTCSDSDVYECSKCNEIILTDIEEN